MKKQMLLMIAIAFTSSSVFAYQVTGPVTDVDATSITVKKGNETWKIAAGTTDITNVKKGDKVTIEYDMTASKIEKKAAKK